MRNFFIFLQRFSNLLLFIALEIVCIILLVRTNTLQGVTILQSANTVAGALLQKREDIQYYFGLRKVNDSLLAENARLRMLLDAEKHSTDAIVDSNVTAVVTSKDTTKKVQYAEYIYHTARVINNTIDATNNYITINRGTQQGVKKNMAVLSGNGTVGRVMYASDNYAAVLSILNVKQKVSAQLADGTIGSVKWEVGNPDLLIMEEIPQQIPVKIGDSVFTTNYSFFPPNVLIGKVVKKKIVKKNNLQYLYIRSATNFRNLQYVYVVENTKWNEKLKVEDSTKLLKAK